VAKKIYLDYAAATPMHPEVLEAMRPYFSDNFYNPSATYLSARANRQKLEAARGVVAGLLGAKPAEIVFTAGATEANNLAVSGVARKFPGAQIMVSAIEHDSVLAPASAAGAKTIPVLKTGLIDLSWLEKHLNSQTVLVSIGLVNNEIGVVQPLRAVRSMLEKEKKNRLKTGNDLPLYLHSDAAQAANYLDLGTSRLGVDLLSLNGGKIYGPKQSGLLYVKAGTLLQPIIIGGGQEFGLRAGTENLPQVVGFGKALELAQKKRRKETERLMALRSEFIKALLKLDSDVQINGHDKHHAPHILSVSFAGHDNERLMIQLDELGIECAVGSACSASSERPSHVLGAIGLSDELARATLRFSTGAGTTSGDIARTVSALKRTL